MKRIIVNILLAFVFVPTIKIGRDYYYFEIIEKHNHIYSGSLMEYIEINAISVFLVTPILFLILVLLPYNLITIRKKGLSYIQKVLVFILIMVIDLCLVGTFSNVWIVPYWKNLYYLIYFFLYGLFFAGIIHFFVDRATISSSDNK